MKLQERVYNAAPLNMFVILRRSPVVRSDNSHYSPQSHPQSPPRQGRIAERITRQTGAPIEHSLRGLSEGQDTSQELLMSR
jgi:hypothetical protein